MQNFTPFTTMRVTPGELSVLTFESPTTDTEMTGHAFYYDCIGRTSFKQRLALTLGARQNQRPAKYWG